VHRTHQGAIRDRRPQWRRFVEACFIIFSPIIDFNPPHTDYRKVPGAVKKVYFDSTPSTHESREFRKLFNAYSSTSPLVENRRIDVWGRKLTVPESNETVALFGFNDLCGKSLGAADYLEVTKTFPIIFVEDVPRLNLDTKDKVAAHSLDVLSLVRSN
jgi:predicted ATPase